MIPGQNKSKETEIARPWERNRTVAIPRVRPQGNGEITAESPENAEQEGASGSTLPSMRSSDYVYVGNMT